jgi:uncharacterized protein (DUF427 family)
MEPEMHMTPAPFVEPTPRRIRVRLGDELVADSICAQLLVQYGPGGLPTYYLPHEDVYSGALVDETIDPDGQRTWAVRAGPKRAEAAAWTHARDPYKRVDTLRSSRRVQVLAAGELVADSIRPLLLFETSLPTRYYLPFGDVRTALLEASDTVTVCPYKGRARYWSLRVGDTFVPDVAWSYPDPIAEYPKIRDLLCFFNERVDLVINGEKIERPASPWPKRNPDAFGAAQLRR